MSLVEVTALTLSEIVGDFGFKQFANQGGIIPLVTGIVGYFFVIGFLIVSLQGSSVMLINGSWDAVSGIIESIAAYIFLGERFEHTSQYFGLIFIVLGLYLLKVPLTRDHKFKMPSI